MWQSRILTRFLAIGNLPSDHYHTKHAWFDSRRPNSTTILRTRYCMMFKEKRHISCF